MTVEKLLLNSGWKIKCLSSPNDFDFERIFETDIPRDVHSVLFDNSLIEDPFWEDNFKKCRWVSRCNWLFLREFTIDSLFANKKIELVFDGIDTYSSIKFNGQMLGNTSNAFLQYRFDISDIVKFDAVNQLEVELRSVRNTIEQRDVSDYFACFNVHRIFSRRPQCQFSWDWAPDLPSVGIYKDVYIAATSGGFIENVYSNGDSNGRASFDITLDDIAAKNIEAGNSDILIDVELAGHGKCIRRTIKPCGGRNFLNMDVDSPKLWWPNGYGEPILYDYNVILRNSKVIIDKYSGCLGFRTVELVQEPLAEDKRSFKFVINSKPVFCMGANWVPCDCFIGEIKDHTYKRLLTLAKDANFNTLRIWGGGMYENDMFYDLCDEMGILVWQDMMFACGDIPDDDNEFIEEVINEFKYQVKRLRNHPCIFHWCGGNEKTGAFGKFVTRGELITKFIARGVITDYIPHASYTPSSPFSYNDMANDGRSGDTHGGTYEEAFADDITKFRNHIDKKRAVFMSEFGLHGPPVIRSLKKFMSEKSLWPLNDIWESHVQDNPYNSISETFVQIQQASAEKLFYKPQTIGDFVKTAGTFYAEYLYAEFQHHRRRLPENSGALIWMLNDCWPAANWSIIDYYGQPKQAYYALKRASQPVMLSFRQTDDNYELYLTNNSVSALDGKVRCFLQDVDGGLNCSLAENLVHIGMHDSKVVLKIDRTDKRLHATNSYLLAVCENDLAVFQEIYFHNLWKNISWPQPDIKLNLLSSKWDKDKFTAVFRLTAAKFARCVNLSIKQDVDIFISDNYFDIPASGSRDIVITSNMEFTIQDIILHHWLTNWESEEIY